MTDSKAAIQQPFFSTRLKALLAIAAFVASLLIISVLLWGPTSQPCKKAFPMVVGCSLGNHETLFSGILAALAALIAAAATVYGLRRQIDAQKQGEVDRTEELTTNLARALHAELADLVARCCFDSECRWRAYWPANAQGTLEKHQLRSYAPAEPTVFANAAGDLASLGEDAPLRLVQFYNGLTALRRDIGDIADGLTGNPANQVLVRQIARRFLFTLKPGLDALRALEPRVSNAEDVECTAIEAYDANRRDQLPPDGTLRVRIERLLKIAETSQQ